MKKKASWQHLLSVTCCAILLGEFTIPAVSAAVAENSTWQSLLDQAEPLYMADNYKDSLPIYKKAVEAVTASGSTADRIRCLRYLADCYCRLNDPDNASAQYKQVEALTPADDIEECITNLNLEACCFELRGNWSQAEALCNAAMKLCSEVKSDRLWQQARTEAHLGYIQYMCSKYSAAIPLLRRAEQAIKDSGRDDAAAIMLSQKMAFAQAGCNYHLRNFEEAYVQFKRMFEYNVRIFGKTDLQTGWAMLAMSDVLAKLKQTQQADDWYRKAIYVFRKYNKDRLCKQFAGKGLPVDEIRQRIDRYVFGNSIAHAEQLKDSSDPLCKDVATLVNTHDPRALYARPFMDAPGRVWLNPLVKQHGIVIAIHGLSLEHSSYDALAKELADAGFCTVAFDVRGFGSYRQALGAEQVSFDECLHDLRLVVSAIKNDNPGTPLFMLGESMGGAIALQFGAQNSQLIDGLIASVPAGKRFKQGKTVIKVALHYLEGRNRPFNIGTDVINQATTDPQLKQLWSNDPKTRSTLSPHELLAFQAMCNRNLECAKQIKSTPVVLFQGVSDGLVKPEATYDLFRAIAAKDKSLIMVGNAEHLIFEEGCFTPPVLKGLIAWMDSHVPSGHSSDNVAH